jgi:hypothetical protein
MADTIPKPRKKEVRPSEAKDDSFEYRLQNDPRFLRRIESARKSLRAGRGTRLEDMKS